MVCEATQCADPSVRKAAYEAIWTIATLYYDRLQAYMQPLFELTLRTIREDQEDVALNAMEFWSSLCDEEVGVWGGFVCAILSTSPPLRAARLCLHAKRTLSAATILNLLL